MEEKYNLSILKESGESEESWEKVVAKLRDIADSIGWNETLQVIEKVSESVKSSGEKKVTAAEIIKALDQAKAKKKTDKGTQSYTGSYSFSGEPDM